jgi:uncharacterized protein (DUF2141 family)
MLVTGMETRAIVRLALLIVACGVAVGGFPEARRQQTATPRTPQTQPRDPTGRRPLPAKAGTGVISGTVSVASGLPAVGARIMLSGADLPAGRTAMTDNQGRFTIQGLAAGSYRLAVSKPGHVTVSYGQRRPVGPGTAIQLSDGERRDITLQLPRGGVITGMVVDERGEPAINTSVRGMRAMLMSGRRRLQSTANATTDDRGIYRLHSLQPGDYAVCVTARNMMPQNDAQRIQSELDGLRRSYETITGPNAAAVQQQMATRIAQLQAQLPDQIEPAAGYAPVCYPATAATPTTLVPVAAGEERVGIDLQLQLMPVARIEGLIIAPAGVNAQNVQVSLENADENMADLERYGTNADNDGRFRFTNVAPGRYKLLARTVGSGGPGLMRGGGAVVGGARGRGAMPQSTEPPLWARADITVAGQDMTNIALELQRGMSLSGHVVFQGTKEVPADLTRLQISMSPYDSNPGPRELANNVQGNVEANGRFTISDVFPGKYRMFGTGSVGAWTVESAVVSGQDTLDFPLEVRPGQNVSGVVVTFIDRPTELSGTIVTEKGQPAIDHMILVYPVDEKYWMPMSRRIRVSRALQDGKFLFRGLPPGDYRLSAFMEAEPGSWFEPSFLQQLEASSLRITLGDGENKVANLRVPGGE